MYVICIHVIYFAAVPAFGIISKVDLLPDRHLLPTILSELAEKICASGAEERVFHSPLYSNTVTPNYERHHVRGMDSHS